MMKETRKRVSFEEAFKIMEGDRFDLMSSHKGFFSESEFPFRAPYHFGSTIVWPPADIHPAAKIGDHCMIGRYTNICGAIEIGSHTRIQGFCFIPDNVKIGSYVFIGPGVTFTNMKYPRVRNNRMKIRDGITVVEDDARIGAGAIIGPGVRIGSRSLVGMGAVVTKDVAPDSIVTGCPARIFGG